MSVQIELLGINKLDDSLLRTGYLVPHINRNDKTPSWDGFVWLYNNKNHNDKKSDHVASIPVQVKGETNPDIFGEQINANIEKTDLKIYLRGGGVIFFVVRMKDFDNYRIYYESLNPFKLKWYIKSMKNRKSINVKLNSFPKDNIDEVTDIFFNFSNDMNKQPFDNIFSLNEFQKYHPEGFNTLSFHYHGIQHNNPIDYLINRETTIYANHSTGNISIPVASVKITGIDQQFNSPVLIENVEYYPKFNLSHSKEGIKIIIGNSVSFLYLKDNDKARFNLKIQGSLSERIKDTEFALALFKNKYFSITMDGKGLQNIYIGEVEEKTEFQKEFDYYSKYLNYLLEIKKVMEILKVEIDLDLNGITKKDEENINLLISAILYNKPQSLTVNGIENISSFINKIKICNISVLILFVKKIDGKYSLSNFFIDRYTATYQISADKEPFIVSAFLSLTKNDFLTLSNIDYDIIYKSFLNLKAKKELFEMTNLFVLNMIDVYDQSKKVILLETSLKLIDWILENDCFANYEITMLNRIQIIKRMRDLSDDELSQLNAIITTSKDEKNLTGAYLLLGDIDMANYHFKKLVETEQEDFKKYPINIFWKKINLAV
jgi:uncharacterized membrane protein YwzB